MIYIVPSHSKQRNFWITYLKNNPTNPLKIQWTDDEELFSLRKKLAKNTIIAGIALLAVTSYFLLAEYYFLGA